MGIPVDIDPPEIRKCLPRGKLVAFRELCRQAGVACKVTGLSAERKIYVGKTEAGALTSARRAGPLGDIWIGVPASDTTKRRALLVLGVLAYGAFDYAARECLRGLEVSRPTLPMGRPAKPNALSNSERQRRWRRRARQRSL